MKFSPIKFQAALAAAGVALMPFVYLQFSVPHGKGIVGFADIYGAGMSGSYFITILVGIMAVFAAAHVVLTMFYLKDMVLWISDKKESGDFMNSHPTNIGIFSPIISLAMSINVLMGPAVFFFGITVQSALLPAFIVWTILWILLLLAEARAVKSWVTKPVETDKLNFGWLLDVFAFGMVSLVGAGIASLSAKNNVASAAALMTMTALAAGAFLFVVKLIILVYHQLRAEKLPEKTFLPGYFTVVPILCLFGVSVYKFNVYLKNTFAYDLNAFSFFVVTGSFTAAAFCILFISYLLKEYFLEEFGKKEFYPSLWSPVCALVGFEVLGCYVYGNYYRNTALLFVCYLSIVMAVVLYASNFWKYHRYAG
ncbi:MAG: hypothetical protein QME32_00005 [Endomicrobiia bacterium]|nr:hypothetical protein [Endomicrobiia bacterium]